MLSKDSMKKLIPKLVTTTVVVAAAACAYLLYSRYQSDPWTRDGQVRADVVQIAPRVNGYLVKIAVTDNQAVSKGDLLFQIDPSQYQLAVDQAEVSLDSGEAKRRSIRGCRPRRRSGGQAERGCRDIGQEPNRCCAGRCGVG